MDKTGWNSDGSVLTYRDQNHSRLCSLRFEELRQHRQLCDVTLVVEDKDFPCHRLILAANSPFFKAMFLSGMQESFRSRITLQDITSEAMTSLLQYIYRSTISISQSNVLSVLHASCVYQMPTVTQVCVAFLKANMDTSNCLSFLRLAGQYTLPTLQNISRRYVLENFEDVCKTQDFMELEYDILYSILTDGDLITVDEDALGRNLLRWIKNYEDRMIYAATILRFVNSNVLNELLGDLRKTITDSRLDETLVSTLGVDSENILSSANRQKPRKRYGWIVMFSTDLIVGQRSLVSLYDPIKHRIIRRAVLNPVKQPIFSAILMNDVIYSVTFAGQSFIWQHREDVDDTWTEISRSFHHQSMAVPVHLNNQIYLVPNSSDHVFGRLMKLGSDMTWKVLDSVPNSIDDSQPVVVVMNNTLHVIGGESHNTHSTTSMNGRRHQCYNPETDSWNDCCPAPVPLDGCCGVALYGFIYVIGAKCLQSRRNCAVYRYDPAVDSWWRVSDLKYPRIPETAEVCNGRIYAFHIENRDVGDELEHNSDYYGVKYQFLHVEYYDASQNTWCLLKPIPEVGFNAAMCTLSSRDSLFLDNFFESLLRTDFD
ncbi:kelch-like protein 25 [Glandiceps talaboti]